MAQLVPKDNIYQAGADAATYYIIPSKLKYSNASVSTSGSSWVAKTDIEILLTNDEHQHGDRLKNQYVWGFNVDAVPSGSSYYNQSWANHTATITFYKAAQHVTEGTLHDVTITISNISIGTRSSYSRYVPVINITDTTAQYYDTGFWIQAETQRFTGDDETGNRRLVGVSARISFSIDGASANETFAYPFKDIDMLYDVNTDSTTSTSRVRNESVDLVSGYNNDVFVVNPTGGHWLTIDSGNKIYRREDTAPPVEPVDDPDGSHTSIVCVLDATGAVVDWAGSVCSTSLLGDGIPTYEIQVRPNGGEMLVPSGSSMIWTTATQYLYKIHNKALQIPYSISQFRRNGYNFIGLSTGSTITIPPFTIPASANYNEVYDATWTAVKPPVWIKTPNGWEPYTPTNSDPQHVGYVWRAQHGPDPNNPDMSQPLAWHLVRPVYVCKTVNGVKQWVNGEG